MADQEKKLYRAKLQIELDDAEEELAVLQDQATSLIEAFDGIASKVRHNARLVPGPADFTAEGDVENRLTPDQMSNFPTADSVAKVIEELKKARQNVGNLREHRRKLARLGGLEVVA